MANIKDRYKGSHNTANLRTNIYERRVLSDTTPGTLRNKTLTSALYKWHYDNGLFDSIKFLWAGDAGIRYAGGKVNKAYSLEQFNQEYSSTEVIVNGDGSTLTNWTTITGVTSIVNSRFRIEANGASTGRLQQTITCVIGKTYKIAGEKYTGTDTFCGVAVGITSGSASGAVYDNTSGASGSFIGTFVATQTTHYIILKHNTVTAGVYAEFDNISVKEFLINDATQTTSANQPYISGNIAPNETYCLKNVNGGGAYMTHPTISFAANQAWSVTTCLGWMGIHDGVASAFCGKNENPKTALYYSLASYVAAIRNNEGASTIGTVSNKPFLGKNTIVSFVSNGAGTVTLYANGVLFDTFAIGGTFTFDMFVCADANAVRRFNGQFHTHQINAVALTATQALSLYNTIRGFIPEIPSVVIGGQTWATSNLEIVANSAGTLITDGNAQATWATNGAAYWCHHTDAATGAIYGKLYNSQAKAVINAGAPSGYRVATKADWTTLITAGGNALKIGGTTYWLNDLGTNSTGFSAIGGGSRAANGTFSTIKATAQFWCGDTNEVLVLNSADNTATFITAETGAGYSIRLIKI